MMVELGSSPKSIIESVEIGWLPSPPHIFSTLLDICRAPDSSIEELTDLISTDAVLTSKIIIAVNSAAFSINQPVKSLKHAITLLGHDQVKSMVLTSAIQQLFAGLINSRKKTVCHAWVDSLYCALFAREIAEALNYERPEDAYLAGLLCNFGQVVFDTKFHEQYADILNLETDNFIVNKEISKFGVSHTELGACIIEQWPSLSPAIADAARFHHEEEDQLKGCDILCRIVAEASKLAWHWSRSGIADIKWHSALIEDEELKKIYIQVNDKMSLISSKLGIFLPKFESLTQDQFSRDLDNVTIRLGRKVRDASLIKVISSGETKFSKIDSPENLCSKVAQDLQLIFSISDVVFLFPDAQNADYLSLYELNHIHALSKFPVDNPKSKIIRSYLEKSNFWIEPEKTQNEISPISDRQIIRRLKHDIGFCLPIANSDQVMGVVVIGSNKVQKNYLANQADFISGYLAKIADLWLRNNQALKLEALEDNTNKQQEQKDIDKLVHEISNPLSVIGNYIDILKLNAESVGKEDNKEIDILKEELQRIRNIVLNFKDAKETESQAVFLNEELRMCIPLYEKSISDAKKVQIKWNLDESDAEIKITRDALRQIILNLVKNAVEAQTNDAEINVSSHHFVNIDGMAFAQFSIADQGGGVDAITRELLFSPLKSTKEGAGRGLGLSVVAELLGRVNGHIRYMENGPGVASFEVLIPRQVLKSDDN